MNKEWKFYAAAVPGEVLEVVYKEKYGPEIKVPAMSIFQSDTEYRLNHPETPKKDLQKSNLISFSYRRKYAEAKK